MKLRPKILLSVLAPLLFGIMVMIVVISSFVGVLNEFAGTQSAQQIFANVEQNLVVQAENKAQLVDSFMSSLVTGTTTAWYFGNQCLNRVFNATPLPSYVGLSYLGPAPPGGLSADRLGRESNYLASAWYYPGVTSIVTDNATQYDIDLTSLFDFPCSVLMQSNPNYASCLVGVERNGLFRYFPYLVLNNYPSQSIVCAIDNQQRIGFDPRCRPWYHLAAIEPTRSLTFTPPFVSTVGIGLVVGAARALMINGTFYGVMTVNVIPDDIEAALLSTSILTHGYAYLIDWQGNLIFHPKIKDHSKTTTLLQGEFEGRAADFDDFSSILREMKEGKIGNSTFTKNEEIWHIAYHSASVAGYTLAVVVPESDIREPIDDFQSSMVTLISVQIVVFVVVMILVSGLFYLVVTKLLTRILHPIGELTSLCEQIAKGDLEKDLEDAQTSSKEIAEIYRTFGALLHALRFGNEEYYKGDKRKAMRNYQKALEMFVSLNNEKALGICYNNIGNVYRYEKNLPKAEESYNKAIEYGVKLNDPPTIESQKALASRYNNLAMLYLYANDDQNNQRAKKLLKKALKLDEAVLDATGMINHYGNMALLMLKEGKIHKAQEMLEKAQKVPFESFADPSNAEQVAKVEEYFNTIKLDPTVLHGAKARPKDVFFLLDYSGSMSGAKNKSSLKGMSEIFNSQVNDNDHVCLMTFSDTSNINIPLRKKYRHEEQFRQELERLVHPTGGTAFFDALGAAFTQLTSESREKWIIALTDGDDNLSKSHSAGTVKALATKYPDTNLVIISVGEMTSKGTLESICKATRSGALIDIDNSGSAITEAFQEVAAMMEAGVETYDFKYDL